MTRFSIHSTLRLTLAGVVVLAGLTACKSDSGTNPKTSIAAQIHAMAWPDTLVAGQSVTFRAAVLDQHGDTVLAPRLSWTNSAPSVLSIQTLANGDSIRVTALRPGAATVSVDVLGADNTVHATGTVHVTLAGARILTPDGAASLPAIGAQLVVSARALGFDGASLDTTGLSWSHGTDSIVTVVPFAGGDSATVTGAHYGTDTVMVTAPACNTACSAHVVLTVGHLVSSVSVSPSADTLTAIGQTLQLTASAQHADSTAVSGVSFTWVSSDSSVATVDSTGLVTVVGAGTAHIFAIGEGIESNGVAIDVSLAPTPGGDLVVFNDLALFQNTGLTADTNNAILMRNLVSYTASGSRASGTTVWLDFGHGSLCGDCDSFSMAVSAMQSLGDTVAVRSTSQGDLTSIPGNVKVIVFFVPTQSFTPAEINTLKQFATDGGRIVFVGENPPTYGRYFSLENAFLANLGSSMTNAGGNFACSSADLGSSSLGTYQITTGMTGLYVGCSSALTPGANDVVLAYDALKQHVLAAVTRVDTTPLVVPTAAIKRPAHLLRAVVPR
ncbi:MAG TPA: Ig-like domain-containing protein [Gemmatimonadaceae bacterium]|nr:Ig-like domain-containing protein [Gemmatimonadaceae bacterium]